MTLLVKDINYNVLEQLLHESETISEDECDMLVQVAIHIMSGARLKSEIVGNFERPALRNIDRGRYSKIVDQYKIIKHISEKIENG